MNKNSYFVTYLSWIWHIRSRKSKAGDYIALNIQNFDKGRGLRINVSLAMWVPSD
jgi:hypothetical protein